MSATLKLNASSRIDSLDLVRGIIMILMLLDHTRDFFHQYAFQFEPEDLSQTAPITFFTRWITHLCAPGFVLLAGVSAFLYGSKKGRTKADLRKFLITRGLFLILLEETVISIAWRFSIDLNIIRGLVIWGLGWSMIFLGFMIYLDRKTLLVLSLGILIFHNLLDPVYFENKILQSIWSFFHSTSKIEFMSSDGASVSFTWRILYPVLPMIALMGVGYWMGAWYQPDFKADIRQGMLFNTGLILISSFVLFRFLQYVFKQYDYIFFLDINDLVTDADSNNLMIWKKVQYAFKSFMLYFTGHFGDPSPLVVQDKAVYTFMSFLNVTKYPFSFFFTLITVGPLLIVLSLIEAAKIPAWIYKVLKSIGSVPLFFYIVHLFVLRLLAFALVLIFYRDKLPLILGGQMKSINEIFGMNIFMVYLMVIVCLALLYPLCRWYMEKKSTGKSWIFSYI